MTSEREMEFSLSLQPLHSSHVRRRKARVAVNVRDDHVLEAQGFRVGT